MSQVYISPERRIIGVPFSAEVHNLFPTAKQIIYKEEPHLVVPHGAVETFFLRKMGYDIPAPILTHYDWPHPIGQPPFDIQKKTAALLTLNEGAYVFNDMGTGKTRALLWAWDYLYGNKACGKLLICAPLSTLDVVWAREIFNIINHRKCAVLHGTRAKRLKLLADPEVDIFIINHDGLGVIYDELRKHPEINVIGIDELAVYRNGSSARTKRMRELCQGSAKKKKHAVWVWGMTGSPIPTSPTDAWAQSCIITPSRVPKYFGRFRDSLMTKVAPFKYVPKHDAVQQAYNTMQPAVRYDMSDVMELPEMVEQFLEIPLSKLQEKTYNGLSKFCQAKVGQEDISAANAGALMVKLLQVATGWVYTSGGLIIPLDSKPRVDALLDAIQSTNRKVLVFVPFKHALNGICEALADAGIDFAKVSGDTPAKERTRIFSVFQATSKYRVIAAHPQCLAHGVTLTEAATIIWFAPVVSLEIYQQANRRIRRVGQKFKQLVLHLYSTPVEKRIYQILRNNEQVQSKFLELFELETQTNPQK